MNNILAVNSSVAREGSVSQELVGYTVDRLLALAPGVDVVSRDLSHGSVPHLTPTTVAGIRGIAGTDDERDAQALSDELIAEVRKADVVVIGAPMYNFSIPTSLRAWFDHVLRPRVTFAYGEDGPKGLLTGKRAIVLQSRGGLYSEGPAKAIDFQEPYLSQLLGFVGITDVTFVHAEKIGFGPEARELALAMAKARIDAVAGRIVSGEPQPPANGPSATDIPTDFAGILLANLTRVFGERDAARRIEAIREIYHEDAVLHEPERSAAGHEAISQAVTDLLGHLPPQASFSAIRPALGHNGLGRLQWRSGPQDGPPAVTGLDVANVEDGRIRTLHVFLDQQGS